MSTRTLFLAWQDKKPSKAWFLVGRLDADIERSLYRFRYIGGAKRAEKLPQVNWSCRSYFAGNEVNAAQLVDFKRVEAAKIPYLQAFQHGIGSSLIWQS